MRFALYPLLTLVGVVLTGTIWIYVLQASDTLTSTGLTLRDWFLIYIVWTISGGIFAWLFSRDLSLWSSSCVVFDSTDTHPLIDKIQRLSQTFGLKKAPQVGIYPSPEVNAFTAGPLPAYSVLAVSQAFLDLEETEQETLLFAEMEKLASGYTALLLFCQGMTHGFVLYFARLLAFFLGTSYRQAEDNSPSTLPEIVVSGIATLFLTLLGSLVVRQLAIVRHTSGENAIREKWGETALQKTQAILAPPARREGYDLFTKSLKARRT